MLLHIDFTINGSAEMAQEDMLVHFTGTPTVAYGTGTTSTVSATATSSETTSATIEVNGMRNIGDSVTVTYKVVNEEQDLWADLVGLGVYTDANSTNAFSSAFYDVDVVLDYGTQSAPPSSNDDALIENESYVYIVVVITLKQIPINNDTDEASFYVNFTANPIEGE